jgi:hypothetical protein
MIFKRKKRMIDVRELQRRGVVRIPKQDIVIPTDNEGFVEMNKSSENNLIKGPTSNAQLFGFANSPESSPGFSSESDGYSKREVDTKIIELDNKIYKLENRVELLEKKLGVEQQPSTQPGIIGW